MHKRPFQGVIGFQFKNSPKPSIFYSSYSYCQNVTSSAGTANLKGGCSVHISKTCEILIDPAVWISSWKTSQYASSRQAWNKLQRQAGSAPAQQTNIHPFSPRSDDHTACFLTLCLWSSDCLRVSLFYIRQRSSDESSAGLIWSLLMVLSLSYDHMTLSESTVIVAVRLY